MDLIIDGYNLMGADQGLSGALESKRNWLTQKVAAYQRRKDFNVFVVFDGWRSGQVQETRQMREGIIVIYSRLGEKADHVIVRLARERGSGCVVVTSDREIHKAVARLGAVAIYSAEFNQILRRLDEACAQDATDEEEQIRHGNPNRLAKTDRKRQARLKKLRL
ncbi:MAG TPA: NYN domain-containing protein [Terriglobales bacterium]|nr:NYN domain-containing protein [Terriglobales bacterium]